MLKIRILITFHLIFSDKKMSATNGENSNRELKTFDERFEHLYGEKVYHISEEDRQTLTTGFRPNEKGCFHYCIRLQDQRNGKVITLTLFQFVRMMKDLREVLFTDIDAEYLDSVDASLQFKFEEVVVPTVIIEVDASIPIPNLFQLNIRNNPNDPFTSIVCSRKTLRKIGELEGEFISTVETLEDRSCNFMFSQLISKCAAQLIESKIPRNDPVKMYNEIKLMDKSPYQSEMFLKYWPLMCTLIECRMRGY